MKHLFDGNATPDQRHREIYDFQLAAKMFKPLSATMSARFQPSKATNASGLLDREAPKSAIVFESTVDQRCQAAKAKMFGPLTRLTEEWHPHRLLCKRFDVPDPFPKSGLVGLVSKKRVSVLGQGVADAVNAVLLATTPAAQPSKGGLTPGAGGTKFQDGGTERVALQTGSGSVQVQESVPLLDELMLSKPKPTIDIFKAIFSDDDEEEDLRGESGVGGAGVSKTGTVGAPHGVSLRMQLLSDRNMAERTQVDQGGVVKANNRFYPPAGLPSASGEWLGL